MSAHSDETSTLDALRALESQLYDIEHMAGIAADRVEDLFAQREGDQYRIDMPNRERTEFAVYHLQAMVTELRGAYLSAFGVL